MDPVILVDRSINGNPRNLFFYGRRDPQQRRNADGTYLTDAELRMLDASDHTTIFDIYRGNQPTRSLLQVRVCAYESPNDYYLIRLLGSSFALNNFDVVPYTLDARLECTQSTTQDYAIMNVERYIRDHGGNTLNHLVLAAHGF